MTKLTYLSFALLACSIVSCNDASGDNEQVQLDELRAQRAQIDAQIKTLEAALVSSSSKPSLIPVSVITASEGVLPHYIDVKGTIDSKSTVMLSSQLPGRITAVYVSSGQTVKAGQILVEVDNEVIKRGIEEVSVQLDFASILYEKQQRLFEQKAGSEIQYLTAKNQLEALVRRMASLREQLSMSRITAPRSGICDNVTAKIGETAAPGMPLMTLVNMSDVRVIADVSEAFVSTVNRGDLASITFAESTDTIRVAVNSVSRVVNPLNRTFRLEISLKNPPPVVRPNATCRVAINDQTIENCLSVPLSMIQRDSKGAYLYVVDATNTVRRRDIVLGITSGAAVQIVQGLAAGENLVHKGATDVADGQVVKIVGQQ